MNNHHLINSAVFEISYAQEGITVDQRSEIDDFVKNNLMLVVDEVFSETSKAGKVFKMPGIEIDLGEIPLNDYKTEMPKKLRENLVLIINEMHCTHTSGQISDNNVVDIKSAEQEELFYFLLNGHLPWYSRITTTNALESILKRTTDSNPEKLKALLGNNRHKSIIVERLVNQFPFQTIVYVFQSLFSYDSDSLQHYIADLKHIILRDELPLGKYGASLDKLMLQVWQAIIVMAADSSRQLVNTEEIFIQTVNTVLYERTQLDSEKLTETLNTIVDTNKVQRNNLELQYKQQVVTAEAEDKPETTFGRNQINTNKLASLYESYELIKRVLTDDVNREVIHESVILEDIMRLDQNTPWLLLRLYRELPINTVSCQQTIENYSASLLHQLVHAYLSLKTKHDTAHQEAFNKAIQLNAYKSRNNKYFYIYVLKRLINEELIDFNEIEMMVTSKRQIENKSEITKMSNTATASITHDAIEQSDQPNKTFIENLTADQAVEMFSDLLVKNISVTTPIRKKLVELFEYLYVKQAQVLRKNIESQLNNRNFVAQLTNRLPERIQVRIISMLGAKDYFSMLQSLELINMACCSADMSVQAEWLANLKWRFIYSYIAETGRFFNEKHFISQYVDTVLVHSKISESRQFRTLLRQQLLQNSLPSTRQLTQRIIQILTYSDKDIADIVKPHRTNQQKPGEAERDEQNIDEDIYVSNAGIVLAAVYIPRLFTQLALTKKTAFINREAAERGVHILQYMVDESVSSPEFQLVLNKILCGVKQGQPICRNIEIDAEDKKQIESLLHGMIQNWTSLGNTSITGLRESFLQRHGRLQLKNDNWNLVVEAKSFDMLLDSLPWSYSTIKLPWMDRVIYVEWR